MIDLTRDDSDDNDDAINDYDDYDHAIDNVGAAQQKWLRHLEELDGYIPVTHDDDNDAITVAEKKEFVKRKKNQQVLDSPLLCLTMML